MASHEVHGPARECASLRLSLAASVLKERLGGEEEFSPPPKHGPKGRSISEFKVTLRFDDKTLLSLYIFLGVIIVLRLCLRGEKKEFLSF